MNASQLFLCRALCGAALIAGCASYVSGETPPGGPPAGTVVITPHGASVSVDGSMTFSATVGGSADAGVDWSVQEGAAGGAIDAEGLYSAPASQATYHVVAKNRADPTKSDVAAVAVVNAWVDITPPGISLDENVNGSPNYGAQEVAVDPSNPATVYLSTAYQGLWRSADSGAHWVKINTGRNGDALDAGRVWALAIDPVSPQTIYACSGYGVLGLGIWKSTDGGVGWDQLFTSNPTQNPTISINGSNSPVTPDIFSFDLDPLNHLHLVATFHAGWKGFSGAGVVESLDGGATWVLHAPPDGMGLEQYVFILNDSATWLVVGVDPSAGTWRTTDSGRTFTRINGNFHSGGGCQLHRAGGGALYLSGVNGVFFSTDNGASWVNVAPGANRSTAALVGTGTTLFASNSNATLAGSGSPLYNPTLYAPPGTADGGWSDYGSQQYANGAKRFAFDQQGRFLFAASWRQGAFRLATQ